MTDDAWIFGYGSLVWRPAFPYRARWPGYVIGFKRRFWQASLDHRGTPEAPGRVVTLLREPGERCWGMVYRVAADDAASVLGGLDDRETGGYQRVYTDAHVGQGIGTVRALLYIATAENSNFTGQRPVAEIAQAVRTAHGMSGSNREYVTRLADALEAMGAMDDHVRDLVRHVVTDSEPDSEPDSDSEPDTGSV